MNTGLYFIKEKERLRNCCLQETTGMIGTSCINLFIEGKKEGRKKYTVREQGRKIISNHVRRVKQVPSVILGYQYKQS